MATKVKVTERAIIARINRKLSKDHRRLCVSRPGSRQESNVGRYHVIDIDRNTVVDGQLELDYFAKKLGVMLPNEVIE